MRRILSVLFTLLLFQSFAAADYYRYVDKDGVTRFVDDLSAVPEVYQDKVQHFQFQNADPKPETEQPDETVMPQDVIEAFEKNAQKEKSGKQTENKKYLLLKEDKALKAEYDLLMEEKAQLLESIAEWSKRYKTRTRKSVARARLKQLKNQQSNWEEKYSDWKIKKEVLDKKLSVEP